MNVCQLTMAELVLQDALLRCGEAASIEINRKDGAVS
jgi:hypothetical protein